MNPSLNPPHRGPECPAPFALEALSAGEAQPAEVAAHVASCPDCSGYVAALKSEREAFLRMRPSDRFLRQVERREHAVPRWQPFRILAWAVMPLALLLVVAPLVLRPDTDAVLTKGGGLRVVALRAGANAPEPITADSRVRAGDALRFSYEASTAGHLLILDLDGTGQASVFHPFAGKASAPIAASSREFLPGSVVLDGAPGPEWLVAVFSPDPLEAAPLLARLEQQGGADAPKLECRGCTVTSLRLLKEP